MTAVAEQVPAGEVPVSAAGRLTGSRVLLTLFLGAGFLLGWLPGRLWLASADCVVAVQLGYQRGRGLPPGDG